MLTFAYTTVECKKVEILCTLLQVPTQNASFLYIDRCNFCSSATFCVVMMDDTHHYDNIQIT